MRARNRVGIGLSYRPARLHTQPEEIGSLESIPGLLKSFKIRALAGRYDNPFPTRFLAPIDCLKIPALITNVMYTASHKKIRSTQVYATLGLNSLSQAFLLIVPNLDLSHWKITLMNSNSNFL
jgi:hypothetical protein